MESHPEYPMSHTICEEIDGNSTILRVRHGGNLPPPGDCLLALFRHCFISMSSVMVLRDLGEQIGWFAEEPEYSGGEDYDFFVRYAKEHGIGIPDGILGQYRNVAESISHRDENWKTRLWNTRALCCSAAGRRCGKVGFPRMKCKRWLGMRRWKTANTGEHGRIGRGLAGSGWKC